MAIPVARVHLAVAHAALPALLPTPPKWKMLPLLPTPPPCLAAMLPKPPPASRADSDERWDARKAKPACLCLLASSASSSSSSGPRSAIISVRSGGAGHGSFPFPRRNATSPPDPKPGRTDSVERWDAHKKTASSASSSSSSSAGTPSLRRTSKWPISRASSAKRWDVHKKERRPPQADQRLDDGESSSTSSSSNDVDTDTEEEEEILWKPRAMYAGPGFVVAAPESSVLTMPTAFLVPVA